MKFYANPYAFNLTGFYFSDDDEYQRKLKKAYATQCHDFEHEVEFIDGDHLGFSVMGECLNTWFAYEDEWTALTSEQQFIIEHLVKSVGYSFKEALEKIEDVHYVSEKATHYAMAYAEESGVSGFALRYFDSEAYARDCLLGGDWFELEPTHGEHITITNLNGL